MYRLHFKANTIISQTEKWWFSRQRDSPVLWGSGEGLACYSSGLTDRWWWQEIGLRGSGKWGEWRSDSDTYHLDRAVTASWRGKVHYNMGWPLIRQLRAKWTDAAVNSQTRNDNVSLVEAVSVAECKPAAPLRHLILDPVKGTEGSHLAMYGISETEFNETNVYFLNFRFGASYDRCSPGSCLPLSLTLV